MQAIYRTWWVAGGIGLTVAAWAQEPDAMLAKARQAAGELGGTLRRRLLESVQQQGFPGALTVCREEAPALADTISGRLGLRVGRTALRVRNPAHQPDEWERHGLAALQAQLEAGADPATVEVMERLPGEVRYLKAILTEPACLACHGEFIDAGLQQEIKRLYPDDTATGFQAGQLRGAFTVRIPNPPHASGSTPPRERDSGPE